jgi:hypothetical protein
MLISGSLMITLSEPSDEVQRVVQQINPDNLILDPLLGDHSRTTP